MESQAFKEWITGVFDRSAELYGEKNNNFFDYFAKNLVAFASIPPSAHVLDVATGRGAILKQLVKSIHPLGKVIGIDISPNMIQHASRDLAEYPNIELVCADAENLEFGDDSFDYVFCGFGVFFFPNVQKALQEFFRVLKPGGKLLISTWGEDDYCNTTFHEIYQSFGFNNITPLRGFNNPDFIFEILSRSGFTKIKTVSDELDYVYPTVEDWISSLWGHATRGKLEVLNPHQMQQLKEALKMKLTPNLKSDGLHKLFRAYYTSALKP